MTQKQYGDFQTPKVLSDAVCRLLSERGVNPKSLLEPTCGTGHFVVSALEVFDGLETVVASDLNRDHVARLRDTLREPPPTADVSLSVRDFFDVDWADEISALPEPVLVLGNPPWVTNADVGKEQGQNLPEKTNFQGRSGLDALTGSSNFDVAEWMLIRLLEALDGRDAALAMLCKRSVARRVLDHRWRDDNQSAFSLYNIDAKRHFDAATDACLFFAAPRKLAPKTCPVYAGVGENTVENTIGYREGGLVSNVDEHQQWDAYTSDEHALYRWRSGIKHDCTRVMELTKTEAGTYRNKLGDERALEDEYVYPLLKSSDVANGKTDHRYSVIVPNASTSADTSVVAERAPKTWAYLTDYAEDLDGRGSSIYDGLPRFAVFGVGDYSFAPWKVAVSGLYDSAQFTVVPPSDGTPVMLDDTCYFLPCQAEDEAVLLARLFNSAFVQRILDSLVFWDDQRPIKISVLKQIDILKVARRLGVEENLRQLATNNPAARDKLNTQLDLMG